MRGATVEKNCKACGSNITVRLADHKRGWGNFCDKACSAAFKCGQRPADVNARHAEFSQWAEVCHETNTKFPPTKAPSVEGQVGGRVRIKKQKRRATPRSELVEEHDGSWDAHNHNF